MKTTLCVEQNSSGPANDLIVTSPSLHSPRGPSGSREAALNQVGARKAHTKHSRNAEPVESKRLLQTLAQAVGGRRADPFEPLHRLLKLRPGVGILPHPVRCGEPKRERSVVALGQVLLDVALL